MKIKTSLIWKLSKADFENLIKKSSTYKEALIILGFRVKSGGNYKTLKARIYKENIDISHIERNKKTFKGTKKEKPLEEILTKNSAFNNSHLKNKLIKNNLLENKCYECGLGDIWNNKPITLQLDHINGEHNDNTIDNLRIICPNCHSQTKNFAGRNISKTKTLYFCSCGSKKNKNAKTCAKCFSQSTKIEWPTNKDLEKLIWSKPMSKLAKDLGISDKAIQKRAKRNNITIPKKGYWITKNKRNT